MIRHHLGKGITEQHRQHWVRLLLETADQLSLPSDPEFRSALVAYLEWGSRLAVINSALSSDTQVEEAPMPKWGWGVPEDLTSPNPKSPARPIRLLVSSTLGKANFTLPLSRGRLRTPSP